MMTFGLTNAPAVFQALASNVLKVNHFIFFFYLDDILTFFRNIQEQTLQVWQVLQRLLENKLFMKA